MTFKTAMFNPVQDFSTCKQNCLVQILYGTAVPVKQMQDCKQYETTRSTKYITFKILEHSPHANADSNPTFSL